MVDRIVFVSSHGESLPLVYRLKKMGIFCPIYLHVPQCQHLYDGLINTKVDLKGLRKALLNTEIVVFDTIKRNEKKRHDGALLKTFGLKANVKELFGAVADKLKKDHKVYGGSEATGEIELDRFKGEELARGAGLLVPETHRFINLNEGIKFLKARRDLWVFKPHHNLNLDLTYVEQYSGELIGKMQYEYMSRIGNNVEYILQKFIEGQEIDTESWFDGENFINHNFTLEDKRLMDGQLGLAIGSQSNIVWLKKQSDFLNKETENMKSFLKGAKYMGPVSFNVIINKDDHKPYFLERTCRCGYDALYCLLTLLDSPLQDFFLNDFKGKFYDGFACSQRISIPPYPYYDEDLLEDYAKNISIKIKPKNFLFFWGEDIYMNSGKLMCAGSDGIIGVVTGRGKNPQEAWNVCYQNVKKLQIGTYTQYRLDGMPRSLKKMNTLKDIGINVA